MIGNWDVIKAMRMWISMAGLIWVVGAILTCPFVLMGILEWQIAFMGTAAVAYIMPTIIVAMAVALEMGRDW